MLLTRNEFRSLCLKRDGFKCLFCNRTDGLSVHHVLERRLFHGPDELGGYFLDNGATLCEEHHLLAESTVISCEEIRLKVGIKNIILPEHLVKDEKYDKWGNIILPNNQRVAGELFNDDSVQRILSQGNVLGLFTKYVKYPRTFHLPWSDGRSDDDKVLKNCSSFENKEIVVTIKMDGECTTLYDDYLHARSINSEHHPSRSWIKGLHAGICQDIPSGWRICGENLYAKHSIHYSNLKDFFLVYSIWNEKNQCLSWDETIEWSALLGLKIVDVIYRGLWDEKLIKNLYKPVYDDCECEGYVVRLADSFSYGQFRNSVAKLVRSDHINKESTHKHWKNQDLVPNILK